MEINKKIRKIIIDNYNLASIFREYCTGAENLYIEQCQRLTTLADILYKNADELYYSLILKNEE